MVLLIINILHKILKKIRFKYIVDSKIDISSKIESGSSFINSTIGKYSFCGYDCEIYFADIGKFSSIANGVIIGGGVHPMDWVCTSPVFYSGRDSVKKKFSTFDRPPVKRVDIGNDVWIGRNAVILSGLKIGTGSVVGAGSIVTKDIPPYEVWAGNPARFLKKRFNNEICESLLNSQWWEFSDDDLQRVSYEIKNPTNFLNLIRKKNV